MKNKKGFTLVELLITVGILGVIVAIAFPVYISVRNNTLEKQFQNVKSEIENKAEEYARDTSIITVSVGKLIEEGYLDPDDESNIYNPVNNESLNCKVVEVTFENGDYTAVLTESGGFDENNGSCEPYDIKTASLIKAECYSETNDQSELAKCEATLQNTNNEWFSGAIKLTPVIVEGKTVSSYRWSSLTGESGSENQYIITTETAKATTYSLALTYSDGSTESGNLIVQLDNEKPTILNVSKDDNWGGKEKRVTIDATDGAFSGIDSYYIGTNKSCPSNEFKTENTANLGLGTYFACAKDKAGNVSDPVEFEIDKIDTTKPTANGNASNYFSTQSSTMGITYYSELTRAITFKDSESQIAQVKYCFTSSSTCDPTTLADIVAGEETKATFSFPANKQDQRVCAIAIDSVGNISETYCDTTFKVDTTAPINVTASSNNSNSSLININATDAESDINKYVCRYGTSSSSLTSTVTASNGVCNLGKLSSGLTYYVQVDAYNNANLISKSNIISFKAEVTAEDAYEAICGGSEYCNQAYYISYNNNLFVAYRNTSQGIKAVYNSAYQSISYLQNGCCNNGNCTYSGSQYTNGILSGNLNNAFLNTLSRYSEKLVRSTWYTGLRGSETSRTANAYVGLMDYSEYTNTKNKSFIWAGANGYETWLLTPVSQSAYINNYTVTYRNGTFSEGSKVVNTDAYSRPVIVLNKSIVFVSGDGTLSNPYRVV